MFMRWVIMLACLANWAGTCTPRRGSRPDVTGATTTSTEATTTDTTTDVPTYCGIQSILPDIDGNSLNSGVKIVNGNQAVPYSWPWVVGIYFVKNVNVYYKCVGTMISGQYVLTSGSCISGLSAAQIRVAVGVYQIVSARSPYLYTIQSFTVHPSSLYDIGVIKLKVTFYPSTTVNSICLPTRSDSTVVYNKNVVVAGWGSTDGTDWYLSTSANLSEAILTVFYNNAKCNPKTRVGDYCVYSLSSLPASVCHFDQGAPLMYYAQSQWYIYGVASYFSLNNHETCNPTKPSYFTRVPSVLAWINKAMLN